MNETNLTEALEPSADIVEEIVASIPDKIVSVSEWLIKIEDALFSIVEAMGINSRHFMFLAFILLIAILSVGRKWKFIKYGFLAFLVIVIATLIL